MIYEEIKHLRLEFQSQTREIESLELYNIVKTSLPGSVVEVGSAWGGTTIVLIAAAQECDKTVYSIDPYPVELEGTSKYYPVGLCKKLKDGFTKNILNGKYPNIIQYNEDTSECIDKIPDNLSVVFIDGLHSFKAVKKEIELLLPKIVQGGFLYIHDANWRKGQLDGLNDDAVSNIHKWILNSPVKNIAFVGSMLKCEKI